MPLYKNLKSKFKPPLLHKNLSCKKSLTTSPPVEVTTNNFLIPIENGKATPQYFPTDSPPAADASNKLAESPKESASFEIKKAARKETKPDQKLFGNGLEEKVPRKRNKEKQAPDNGKNKTDKKKLKAELQGRRNEKLKKFEKPKSPANKVKNDKISCGSQNTQSSISQHKKLKKFEKPKTPAKKDKKEKASCDSQNSQLSIPQHKKVKKFEKSKTPAKKNKKGKTSYDSQNSQLSISQQYLLLEKINEPAPPENASQKERLEWLQNERSVGLYVQCDSCDKFRYLADVMDPTDLPEKWYCFMNKDCEYNSCDVPEVKLSAREEEDMIFNEYNAGSIVWAKLPPYPWWPAMVDDDPDVEQYYWLKSYSDVPTHYNVTFFDSELVSRSWITPKFLKPFRGNEDMFSLKKTGFELKFFERFHVAKRQAIEALSYNILDRLKKFSFLARWPYDIGSYPDDNDKKRQKRNKKRKTYSNNQRKIKITKNQKKTTIQNRTKTDNKQTTFFTDEQSEEMDWKNVVDKENDNAISVSYSPDVSFDFDLF
ncbi:zinc finger CW-type PWWP domain protein 1-like [Agrilus planipennis]|uniref:Zinc finger CW-type PWWP domain protein 1-like n=1 Tax=Agrilus planipennis TaxID=224129 RepID=A0A1W4WWI7_AGRPL|nr:zinc finger CW-type PWWP domain protein 1-like [Agrilus planipennis]